MVFSLLTNEIKKLKFLSDLNIKNTFLTLKRILTNEILIFILFVVLIPVFILIYKLFEIKFEFDEQYNFYSYQNILFI